MENSKIEWTNHTFNPWIGCTKVSAGCANCYAETLDKNRFSKTLGAGTSAIPVTHWGKGAPRHRTSAAMWREPLKWNREAEKTGTRPRVFCASLADVFDDEISHQWRLDLFDLIRKTPHLDWLLLTKRPENIDHCLEMALGLATESFDFHDVATWLIEWINGNAPSNVWLGTSVENQEAANKRIPDLLKIPARVRFLSCEPLLGFVDLEEAGALVERGVTGVQDNIEVDADWMESNGIHMAICGGESGSNPRPMEVDWARDLRDQCLSAGIAFHFKQWGGKDKKKAGRLLDGRTWDELPA